MTWRKYSWLAGWIAPLALVSIAPGCGFRTLKESIQRADAQVSLEGSARLRGSDGPIVVVVVAAASGNPVDFFLLPHAGPFFFTLPAGAYRVGAFEDRNRDLSHQAADEPALLFGAPTDLVLQPGERRSGIDLVIAPSDRTDTALLTGAASRQREVGQFPALQLGTLVTLDDPRFSHANSELGLWDPLRFLFEVGAGVYFLEPYDPDKIPVLFVHGAMGSPGNWKYLVGNLDRSRFQPWFLYYPTAPRLEGVATGLVRAFAALQFRYGFTRIVLVAHSMGGLVTRAAVNYAMQEHVEKRAVRIQSFVTISTPWAGHKAAEEGVKHSPVAAPSWQDMAPGSPFLLALPQTALPPECEYSLLFSYGGGGSMFAGGANDGTVTLASELSLPIQLEAGRVMGFDASHMGILQSADVAEQLNKILTSVAADQP